MEEEKKISIRTNKLYQLLITECRYGYSRNNHLMPSCAYSDVKDLLEELLFIDSDCAIRTAKQLCEECISDQLTANFYDGLDDEFENRQEAIGFIKYLMNFVNKDTGEWKPYNYYLYEENLKKEDALKYTVFELTDPDVNFESPAKDILMADGMDVLAEDVSKKEAEDVLFENIFKSDRAALTFNKVNMMDYTKAIGYKLRIISPEAYKGKIYCIVLSKKLAIAEFEKIEFEGL